MDILSVNTPTWITVGDTTVIHKMFVVHISLFWFFLFFYLSILRCETRDGFFYIERRG